MGLNTELDADHMPAECLAAATNMYYQTPSLLRSRGGFDLLHDTGSSNDVTRLYYWDLDSKLYIANDNAELFKDTTAVAGVAENVTSMVSFGVGATPTLIVAEEKGAQDHTLHTYDGTTYAKLTGTAVPNAQKVMARADGRLLATCDPDHPSRLYGSDVGAHTIWQGAYGGAFWMDIAPGQDGDIVDWIDYQQALYVWKERAVYRVAGDHPQNYTRQRLYSCETVIPGTIVDVGNGVLYATQSGVFPLNIVQQSEEYDLTRRIETYIQAKLGATRAAFSREMGAYIMTCKDTIIFVSNVANRPDVWTLFSPPTSMSCAYQGPKFYLGSVNGKVYIYDHDDFKDDAAAFTVQLTTGNWDIGDQLKRKNIRFVSGLLNGAENATATIKMHVDGSGAASQTTALTAGTRNLIECNLSAVELAIDVTYTSLTGPCYFGFIELRVVPEEDIM